MTTVWILKDSVDFALEREVTHFPGRTISTLDSVGGNGFQCQASCAAEPTCVLFSYETEARKCSLFAEGNWFTRVEGHSSLFFPFLSFLFCFLFIFLS